ncbi:MAG: LysM peptidoglycan-binding domain-containing protein [Alphaproteobacteria bacterium]|nr:LysM peptidoglycan-binding domain-containing protein [Alphaproteobacteria bacterium]
MVKKNSMGKTKRSTNEIIEEAIAQQNDWMEKRRNFTGRFLRKLNSFLNHKKTAAPVIIATTDSKKETINPAIVVYGPERRRGLAAYWFPIMCALAVIFIAIWFAFIHSTDTSVVAVTPVPNVPDPVIQTVEQPTDTNTENVTPSFDIVRIEPSGNVVVAGRWVANQNISIVINGKITATERTDGNGEFVYAPVNAFAPGNYTLSLIGADSGIKSQENVFLYVSAHGYENSVSLLMTREGSTLLQSPKMLADGDLSVSKIDYLDTGRIVVTGDALPRLRVSLTLNERYMGFARVSDHHHFGLGADVGQLETGREYTLTVRLHDGDGNTVARVEHKFTMPEMTGDDDTYYTVRRGDCLWIIARNFLRRGVLFSIIAKRNNIANPDLIFPKQILQIPVSVK